MQSRTLAFTTIPIPFHHGYCVKRPQYFWIIIQWALIIRELNIFYFPAPMTLSYQPSMSVTIRLTVLMLKMRYTAHGPVHITRTNNRYKIAPVLLFTSNVCHLQGVSVFPCYVMTSMTVWISLMRISVISSHVKVMNLHVEMVCVFQIYIGVMKHRTAPMSRMNSTASIHATGIGATQESVLPGTKLTTSYMTVQMVRMRRNTLILLPLPILPSILHVQ